MKSKSVKLLLSLFVILVMICNIDFVEADSLENFKNNLQSVVSSNTLVNIRDVSIVKDSSTNSYYIDYYDIARSASKRGTLAISTISVSDWGEGSSSSSSVSYYKLSVPSAQTNDETAKEWMKLGLMAAVRTYNFGMGNFDYYYSLLIGQSLNLTDDGVSLNMGSSSYTLSVSVGDGLKTYSTKVEPAPTVGPGGAYEPEPSPSAPGNSSSGGTSVEEPSVSPQPSQDSTVVSPQPSQDSTGVSNSNVENPNTGIYYCASLLLIVAVFSGIFYSLMYKKNKFPQV